jgi:hypothetical protein
LIITQKVSRFNQAAAGALGRMLAADQMAFHQYLLVEGGQAVIDSENVPFISAAPDGGRTNSAIARSGFGPT